MDYESAAHLAVHTVFPEVRLKGCNFHFSQALNRKLQQLGLRDTWNDEGATGNVRRNVSMLLSGFRIFNHKFSGFINYQINV